jgi:hypothetical protein
MDHTSDSHEIAHSTAKRSTTFLGFFVAMVVLVNAIAVYFAWRDGSWGAVWIAFIAAPAVNAVMALVSLCATPALQPRRAGWFFLTLHILASVLIPALAWGADFFIIDQMPIHGC